MSNKEYERDENPILLLNSHDILHLSAERVAQMLIYNFINSDIRILFVNCHLHHIEEDEIIRFHQAKNIIKWIEQSSKPKDIIFIVGDFNALPHGLTYNFFIKNNFISIYKQFHGEEPEKTFHNKMEAPFKDASDDGTFDYILYYLNLYFMKNIKTIYSII